MPPDPPRSLRLRRSRGALRRQENIHVRCFQKYVEVENPVTGGLEAVQPILDELAVLVTNFISYNKGEKVFITVIKLVIMYFNFHFPSLGWSNR